jgi:signal transduction histidine kinase
MSVYSQKRRWKIFLLLGAIAIGTFTLWYTNRLTDELKDGELRKIEQWAEAIKVLSSTETGIENHSMNLVNMVISNNTTIPVILADTLDNILSYNNLEIPKNNPDEYIQHQLKEMKHKQQVIIIDLGGNEKQYLYYNDSTLLYKLSWFPIIQLLVVSVFIIVAYMAFSGARRAEQNQVWVGMAKETAHQLGTPTSSLLAWIDLLKLKTSEASLIEEMSKDVSRLKMIADRFSKIGAHPDLIPTNLPVLINNTLDYLKVRSSKQITFELRNKLSEDTWVGINTVLFEWVIENICKNAIDSMEGKGTITISLQRQKKMIQLDITDTGKGMSRKLYKSVFEPGFTSKKRGWGLGLTLVKRIVEEYHHGKVFVAASQPGVGTTFRIMLKTMDKS